MTDFLSKNAIAFAGMRRIARGPLPEVALAAKAASGDGTAVLIFDQTTGGVIDVDLRGDPEEIRLRLVERTQVASAAGEREDPGPSAPRRGRGRPKLGVVSREVTLLPRHWDWLAAQPGGASQALRRLVDQARRGDRGTTEKRAAQEAAYRFMTAMGGDLPGFEEAVRAVFADDRKRFQEHTSEWPEDVRAFALARAFGPSETDNRQRPGGY